MNNAVNPNPSGVPNMIFQLRSMLQSAQNVLIALSQNADEDATAAALALYLVLSKMRKQTTVISSSEVKVERAHLFGIDKITNQIAGGNTLVVSLPYSEGAIEKVSYNIENNRFNLVIEPRGNALSFNPDQIEYNYGKGDFDLVFVIGASQLSDLGPIATKHANAFEGKTIINIDNAQNNTGFGKVNLVNNGPISQIVTMLLKSLRIPIDQDPASNLYTGITSAQQGVTLASASPDSLEAIAFLLRSNATLLTPMGTSPQTVQSQRQQDHPVQAQQPSFMPQQQNVQPMPAQQLNPSPSLPNQGMQQTVPVEEPPMPTDEEAPEDWLKPKIFTTQRNSNIN